jgi:DNA modification methylase
MGWLSPEPIQSNIIHLGDALSTLKTFPKESVQCCVTSPPYYGLRDYGVAGQAGLEETPESYVSNLVYVFREVKRVLKNDGTFWLVIGDSYAGSGKGFGAKDHGKLGKHATEFLPPPNKLSNGLKPKDLIGVPWRTAFALQEDGWWLRSDIIWHKPNPIPSSATDRCTVSHEYIFMLSKSQTYYYDAKAIAEPAKYAGDKRGERGDSRRGTSMNSMNSTTGETKNKRDVWTITTKPYRGAHFATFPPDLIRPMILAGSKPGDVILDPFCGSGTTCAVAEEEGRKWVGIELNPAYIELANQRIAKSKKAV